MALRAFDAGAEEDAHRVRQIVQRHAEIAHVVADGGVVPHLALSGEQFACEDIIRHVFPDAFLHVLQVGLRCHVALASVRTRLHAEQIGPEVKQMLRVAFAGEQPINEERAFVFRFVREERACLLQCGDASDDVEMHATHEGLVTRRRIALKLVSLPVRGQQGVDLRG